MEAKVQGIYLSDREGSGESLSLNRFMIQMSFKAVIYLCLDIAVCREAAFNCLLLPMFCQYLPRFLFLDL